MIPAWMIEELKRLKEEQAESEAQQIQLEIPEYEPIKKPEVEDEVKRGVIVIDIL